MINFDEPIRDVRGAPVKTDGELLTLATVAIAALQHLFPGEDISAEIKARRFKLAVKIAQADKALPLTADEVATLKLVVGKFWNPTVVGRTFEAIDPEGMKAL